jgi:hypothetical protein
MKLPLALLLSVTTTAMPAAMTLGAAAHPVAAAHAHDHHGQHAPASHHHSSGSTCCDLCAAPCGACPGLAPTAAAIVPAPACSIAPHVVAGTAPVVAAREHRCPFSIGPPAFRIA